MYAVLPMPLPKSTLTLFLSAVCELRMRRSREREAYDHVVSFVVMVICWSVVSRVSYEYEIEK